MLHGVAQGVTRGAKVVIVVFIVIPLVVGMGLIGIAALASAFGGS
jgi:hypothetical protein